MKRWLRKLWFRICGKEYCKWCDGECHRKGSIYEEDCDD